MKKNQSQEDFIDIKAIINRFLSKWYYFAIALFLFIVGALIIIKTSPKVYKVSSVLQMKTGATKAEKILDPVEMNEKAANIEDEILVIKSTNYIKETLEKLDMDISYYSGDNMFKKEVYSDNFPFTIELDSSQSQITGIPIYVKPISGNEFELEVKGEEVYQYNFFEDRTANFYTKIDFNKTYSFNKPIKEKLFGLTVKLNGDIADSENKNLSFVINNPENLVKQYSNKIEVEPAGRESSILLLSVTGSVIPKEKVFLDTLMQVVKQKDLDQKNIEGIKTIEFIDYQLANVTESLSEAEQDLESFQYSTSSIGESSALYERRDRLETELSDLNVKLRYFQNILNNLESVESVSKISAPATVGVDDPILSNLLIKISDLNQQRIQVGRTATEANPIVQRIELNIKTTKEALRDNLSSAINTTNIKINDVQSRIGQTNAMINRLPSTSIRKLGLQRKFDFSDNTYELFQERKAAAAIALATNESDWNIVEYATVDQTPVSPKSKFLLLLAVFLGVVLPATIILIMDYLNNKIKSRNDLEKITDIPLLGTISKGNKNAKLLTEYSAKSPLLESFRDIRINLQYLSTNSNKHKMVIGFTSSTSEEGKTFCSANLGIVLAQSGKKTLVLDADLRNSKMASYFNMFNKEGLSTYLIGNSKYSEIINSSKVENLDVILSGPFPPNPFELLNLERCDELLNKLMEEYDYIIIDSPPVGLVSDYMLLQKHIDVNVYVTRYNVTEKNYLEKINDLYEKGKIRNLSVLLNDVKFSKIYGGVAYSDYNGNYYDTNLGLKKEEDQENSKVKV